MARRHWRFIVRDAYGYAIQNAKVNVYQPGTTTAFLGSAFDAASGGSAVTNPLTTNNQGEVQAWFDTEQTIDVAVDDNSDTAYRAVDGVGSPISFTAFTEADRIEFAPEDLVSDLVNHGASLHDTTVSDNPHGAADHTSIARQIFLPVNDGVVIAGGTLSSLGTEPNEVRTIALADAATSGAVWAFTVPDDWDSGTLSVTVYFSGATTTTGSVRWTITAKKVAEGGDVTAAGTAASYTSDAPTTANLLVIDPTQASIVTPAAAGELVMIGVQRIGTDGADNYAATAHLIGILVGYTANQ